MTMASDAIAMCGCGGVVVVQRMVTAMKWLCKLDAPVRAGVCPPFVAFDTPADIAVAAAVAVAVAVMVQV